jgi:thioredoxin-dependent peroxiredoxin
VCAMKRILMAALLAGCTNQPSPQAAAPTPAPTATATAPAAPTDKKAPDFTLNDSEGKPVALHDLLQKGPVILAFFPKAFTGGCTKEMEGYRDRYEKVQTHGAQVVAVSVDDEATLKKFKESLGAPFTFLSDPDGKVATQYGGVDSGHAKRATYTIAKDGTIGHEETGTAALVPDPSIDACAPKGGPTKT